MKSNLLLRQKNFVRMTPRRSYIDQSARDLPPMVALHIRQPDDMWIILSFFLHAYFPWCHRATTGTRPGQLRNQLAEISHHLSDRWIKIQDRTGRAWIGF